MEKRKETEKQKEEEKEKGKEELSLGRAEGRKWYRKETRDNGRAHEEVPGQGTGVVQTRPRVTVADPSEEHV